MGCICSKNTNKNNSKVQDKKVIPDDKKNNEKGQNNLTNKEEDNESVNSYVQRKEQFIQLQNGQKQHNTQNNNTPHNISTSFHQRQSSQQNNTLANEKGAVNNEDLINDNDEEIFQSKIDHIQKNKNQKQLNKYKDTQEKKNIPAPIQKISSKQVAALPYIADLEQNQEQIQNKIQSGEDLDNKINEFDEGCKQNPKATQNMEQIQSITPTAVKKSPSNKIVPVQKTIPKEFGPEINDDSMIRNEQVLYSVLYKKGPEQSQLKQSGVNSPKRFRYKQSSLMNQDDIKPLHENEVFYQKAQDDFSELSEQSVNSIAQKPKVEITKKNTEIFRKTDSNFGESQKFDKEKSVKQMNQTNGSFGVFSEANLNQNEVEQNQLELEKQIMQENSQQQQNQDNNEAQKNADNVNNNDGDEEEEQEDNESEGIVFIRESTNNPNEQFKFNLNNIPIQPYNEQTYLENLQNEQVNKQQQEGLSSGQRKNDNNKFNLANN